MPLHLGIIPDGNRRWCKLNDKTQMEYSIIIRNMVQNVFDEYNNNKDREDYALQYPEFKKITEISVYILSKDNVTKRDKTVVDLIEKTMDLICTLMCTPDFQDTVKLDIIGDPTLLPLKVQEQIQKCVALSSGTFPIHLAVGYDPIEDSALYLSQGVETRTQIDLVVRSGGQLRSSGFFPLQILYAEWVYFDDLWPDMTREHIHDAIIEFQNRHRNFGK